MNAVLVPAVKTLRNARGLATWVDFDSQLRAATELTFDLGLEEERRILETTMFRGQRLLDGGADPRQVLFMFTEKLPNAHGVDQATLDRDLRALKAIVEASGGSIGVSGGGDGLVASPAHAPVSLAPPLLANGRPDHPPMMPYQGPPPHGAWTRSPPVAAYGAAAAQPRPHMLPRGQGRGGRSNAGMGGRGAQGPPAFHPDRDQRKRQRFNHRLEAQQQTYPAIPGGPICENCKRASRNPNHDHTLCAFSVCRRCKLAGHRASMCTNVSGF